MCAKSLQSRLSLCNPKNYSPPGSCPRDSPGKNTGVDCHVLLQGIFPTQGSNPDPLCLLRWQVGSLPLVPLGKPRKQGGNGISFSTHEDHTHRSKKLSWLCEVVQSEGRHLPEETPCEHILNIVLVGAAAHSVLLPCCYLWCTVSSVFFT